MKPAAPSLNPLPNPRHEAFAREIASGKSATQAYINIYGPENRRVASTGGSRFGPNSHWYHPGSTNF